MEEIRKSAKTVEAAVEAALAELGATREEVDITVIDEGSKGFLGMPLSCSHLLYMPTETIFTDSSLTNGKD